MRIIEIVAVCPRAADIMAEYGLHCFSCSAGGAESLAEGCRMHGLSDDQIDALVEDINDLLCRAPARPSTLSITAPAARAMRALALEEGRGEEGLSIIVDAQGAFSLEFREAPAREDSVFFNDAEPSVRIFASPLALLRIGGATIDVRGGRFTLDFPEDHAGHACACAHAASSGPHCGCGR